jgi:hypothetical protein
MTTASFGLSGIQISDRVLGESALLVMSRAFILATIKPAGNVNYHH